MKKRPSRRDVLALCSAVAGASIVAPGILEDRVDAQTPPQPAAQSPPGAPRGRAPDEPFGYCFNTSTIRGQKLPLDRVVEIVGRAGWDGVEPWMDEVSRFKEAGGSLADLRKRIADAGMAVPSAIGFAEWIVDDADRRRKALEHARRDMDLVAQLGGTAIAAPPAGARDVSVDLAAAAERYHALCEVGRQAGVVPQVEVWGFSKTFGRLAEAVYCVVASGHPDACVLADPYHLHKGGSSFDAVKLLSVTGMRHWHVNDYPAEPPREKISDEHRVYPGDGVAPLAPLFRTLRDAGYRGMLSLELFNKTLYQQDPLEVAKTGLAKTKGAVRAALA